MLPPRRENREKSWQIQNPYLHTWISYLSQCAFLSKWEFIRCLLEHISLDTLWYKAILQTQPEGEAWEVPLNPRSAADPIKYLPGLKPVSFLILNEDWPLIFILRMNVFCNSGAAFIPCYPDSLRMLCKKERGTGSGNVTSFGTI